MYCNGIIFGPVFHVNLWMKFNILRHETSHIIGIQFRVTFLFLTGGVDWQELNLTAAVYLG